MNTYEVTATVTVVVEAKTKKKQLVMQTGI